MDRYTCPVCGASYKWEELSYSNRAKSCWTQQEGGFGKAEVNCKNLNICFFIETYILEDMEREPERREKLLNLATEHTLHAKYCEKKAKRSRWHFYFDDDETTPPEDKPECINLARKLKDYPENVMEVANRSLMNLGVKYPEYGAIIGATFQDYRLLFIERHADSTGPYRLLNDFGYVKATEYKGCYVITAAGWQKIDELRKEEKVVRQAFIAMIFREEASPIREAFRQAIHEMGYQAVVLDEKEHNNQIVPEIFYEIKRSKFVVVDVTYPSYGAYYEAGYAQALDKEVSICCREDVFADAHGAPHFDISQKSIIVWKDEADLVRRLKRRIEATVT